MGFIILIIKTYLEDKIEKKTFSDFSTKREEALVKRSG